MKILFFSVTGHQKKYFTYISDNIQIHSSIVSYPSVAMFARVEWYGIKEKTDAVLGRKYQEIDRKYTNYFYRIVYKTVLKLQVPLIVALCEHMIKKAKPTHIALWNGKKFHQELALVVAERYGLGTIYFENGVLPKTTTMDAKGVNASNSLPRELDFYRKYTFSTTQNLPISLIPRGAKKRKKTFDSSLPERYIFVPFQVAYDTQIIRHSPWIPDMYKLFEIVEMLSDVLDICFVIKEHPSDNYNDYQPLHQRTTSKIRFSSLSTQLLIEKAEVVMTINSSVAIESLLFHKRVLVLGEAFFAIEGIVKTADSYESILDILETLDAWKVSGKEIDQFLKYLYYEYLIPGDWREADTRHCQAIEERLKEWSSS